MLKVLATQSSAAVFRNRGVVFTILSFLDLKREASLLTLSRVALDAGHDVKYQALFFSLNPLSSPMEEKLERSLLQMTLMDRACEELGIHDIEKSPDQISQIRSFVDTFVSDSYSLVPLLPDDEQSKIDFMSYFKDCSLQERVWFLEDLEVIKPEERGCYIRDFIFMFVFLNEGRVLETVSDREKQLELIAIRNAVRVLDQANGSCCLREAEWFRSGHFSAVLATIRRQSKGDVLTEIDFSETAVTTVPASLVAFTHLEELDLSQTDIVHFPRVALELKRLSVLNVESTDVASLPVDLEGQLHFKFIFGNPEPTPPSTTV